MMKKQTSQHGFAMLFTVLVMGLILSIALSISNITFKQTLLSSLARDSQIAFYQADAGIECALYYDGLAPALFVLGSDLNDVPQLLECGSKQLVLDTNTSYVDYFHYYDKNVSDGPCFSVTFDKSTDPEQTILQSRGKNLCLPSPRQVERALEARY